MSAPNSPFILLWIDAMLEDYNMDSWAYVSGAIPSKLALRYPTTVHLEVDKLHKPNWQEIDQIVGPKIYDWSENYSVHLWYRLWEKNSLWSEWKFTPDAESIKKLNTTFGQIARMIYYGSKEII